MFGFCLVPVPGLSQTSSIHVPAGSSPQLCTVINVKSIPSSLSSFSRLGNITDLVPEGDVRKISVLPRRPVVNLISSSTCSRSVILLLGSPWQPSNSNWCLKQPELGIGLWKINEPRHEKTNILHMRKQRRR